MIAVRHVPPPARQVAKRSADWWGQRTSSGRRLPDILIAGAQRCGTTSLFRALLEHPDFRGPTLSKAVHYFDTADRYSRGLDWYRGHFPLRRTLTSSGATIRTGEASPYYVFHPLAAARIASALPDVRVIVLLRDPVERAWSAHKQETGRGFETEPFERALDLEAQRTEGEEDRLRQDPRHQSFAHQHHAYVARGHYAPQLRRLHEALGEEQVLAVETDLVLAPDGYEWDRVLDHVGLRPWRPERVPHANARPSSPMPESVRRRLSRTFETPDEDLARLLGRVPAWRTS